MGPQPRAETPTAASQLVMSALASPPSNQPMPASVQPLTIASIIAQSSASAFPIAAQPELAAPLRRALGEPDQPQVASIATPSAATLQQVAATPDAQQGTLDMRRQEWMGKMVETIAAMRDAAPAKETRISLMPDALGKVDISIRHDGDRVHVNFATETPAARQILTDAQPRLTELAESRGIRLGQTSFDAQGGAGTASGQRQGEAPRSQTPSAPASARTAEDSFTATDDRVA
jgi:flagellar hook-length control protein FliK